MSGSNSYVPGQGPVLVYCTDCTPAADSSPVTLCGPVPYAVTHLNLALSIFDWLSVSD